MDTLYANPTQHFLPSQFNVARVDLSKPDADTKLAHLMQAHGSKIVKGIRMILNWQPTWPLVERSDYVLSEDFEQGYAALAKYRRVRGCRSWLQLSFPFLRYGLSFDLQINPRQLKDAAKLVAKVRREAIKSIH